MNIIITDEMKKECFSVFKNNQARDNANYLIQLEIIKQINNNNDYIPFPWEISQEIKKESQKINDIIFKEYLNNLRG